MFHLGEGETDGLRYEGLRERILAVLGDSPFEHRALNHHKGQESTAAELQVKY